MTSTTAVGLALVAGMVLLLAAVSVVFIEFDAAGRNGAAIGAGLGLLNLAVGYLLTKRSLRHGMKSAMATLLGGFLFRLLLVVALVLAFHKADAISEVAFALSFLVFFFAYIGLEILLVDRALGRTA